jgi:hypothetical protein
MAPVWQELKIRQATNHHEEGSSSSSRYIPRDRLYFLSFLLPYPQALMLILQDEDMSNANPSDSTILCISTVMLYLHTSQA